MKQNTKWCAARTNDQLEVQDNHLYLYIIKSNLTWIYAQNGPKSIFLTSCFRAVVLWFDHPCPNHSLILYI